MQTFNEWVQAQGFNPESLTEQQRLVLKAAWRASQPEPAPAVRPDGTPAAAQSQPTRVSPAASSDGTGTASQAQAGGEELMEQMLARTRAENDRRQGIAELVSRYLDANPGQIAIIEAIGKAAIQSKWTLQETELRMMRDVRSNGPIVYAPSQPTVTSDVLEAALCKSGGLKQDRLEAEFRPQTLEAADKQFRRGIGLQEVINLAARANGMRDPDARRNTRATLRAAFRESDGGDHMPRADVGVGASGISISGILSNVANKYLREAFNFVESSWRQITATRPVSDFKEISGYSLTGDLTYEKVAPGGEIKHGTLGEETYGNKADTYGKLIGIDRRDIINDDLGAITSVSRKLGRGGALKVNDVFWTAFMDNSTFFTTGNSNYDDGTDTAFGADGLFAADVFWRAMTDPDGKPMGHTAKILLVPSNHYLAALRITKSERQVKDSLDGDNNVFAGLYQVVTSSYLNNSAYTGYSTKAWYLLCDPNDIPVIETVFLNGQEMPTIETAEMDFDRLGIALRGFHDFGVRKQEPRGGFKFKGEA